MSKKQASLLSFFNKGVSSPKAPTPARNRPVKEEPENESPPRGLNLVEDEDRISPAEATPKLASGGQKRRRLIVSSDDEAEKTENEIKRIKSPKAGTDMADSFINSFRFEDSLDNSMDETMNTTVEFETGKKLEAVGDKYAHEELDWLKPEKVRDASKKLASDPDYDPTSLYVPADFFKQQTPGHQQWWQIKATNFDTVLLFKVGKFYELYHMDATVAVTCLNLTYMKGNHAHAGFPEAAYGKFADQLVQRGYKVARVEQTETPQQLEERNVKKGGTKEKVVKRELCRITTTATKTYGALEGDAEADMETGTKYLFALKEEVKDGRSHYGACFIDTSLGQFNVCQFADDDYRSFLRTLLAKFTPSQLLLERGHISPQTSAILNTMLTSVPKEYLTPKRQFLLPEAAVTQMAKSKYFGEEEWPESLKNMLSKESVVPKPAKESELAWSSVGAVLNYLERCLIDVDMVTMRNFVTLDTSLVSKTESWKNKNLIVDGVTIYNLNLIPSADMQASTMSLYSTINFCTTPFGRRLLRQWICSPSCDAVTIEKRQLAVEFLHTAGPSTPDIKQMTTILKDLPDLERLLQKIHVEGLKYRAESHPDSRAQMFEGGKYTGRRVRNLAQAVDAFSQCLKLCRMETRLEKLDQTKQFPGSYEFVAQLLSDTFAAEMEMALTTYKKNVNIQAALESGHLEPNAGVDADYDEAVEAVEKALQALESYRKEQEAAIGCSISYWGTGKNRYQLEIPDNKKLPRSFDLKSRKKNIGRYHTPELVELIEELGVVEAQKEKQTAESARKVFEEFDSKRNLWTQCVDRLAQLDVIISFVKYAQTSATEVCRPVFDFHAKKPFLSIENGSHPSLSAQIGSSSSYIANDTTLGLEKPNTMLLTGPNMGGKSTLMRQVAVLTVMAHMGSLVPARSMRLTPVDRIFTRIGANDRLMCGQSTFFVEMNEMKIIMRDATEHSLVLVDELGRGTSTFDGTAIATAVLSDLANRLQCRSFFSTHYHSLCETATSNSNIFQAHMACMVENENDEDPTEECVTFLYKLADGPCPKSYGFYAAKLAGISDETVRYAYKASERIAGATRLDEDTKSRLKLAAEKDIPVEQLRIMIEGI